MQKLPCLSTAGLWDFYCLLNCMYGGLITCMIIPLNLCWIDRQEELLFCCQWCSPNYVLLPSLPLFFCISKSYTSCCILLGEIIQNPPELSGYCALTLNFWPLHKIPLNFHFVTTVNLRLLLSLHMRSMWFFKHKIVSLVDFLSQITLLTSSA